MEPSLRLFADRFHLPHFAPMRENAVHAPDGLRQECLERLRREEFAARLRWDHQLHTAALARLARERREQAWRRLRRAFLGPDGAEGIATGALLHEGAVTLLFADGWQPQHWLPHIAAPGRRPYWWSDGAHAALLARVGSGRRCGLVLPIIATAPGFTAAEIVLHVNGRPVRPALGMAEGVPTLVVPLDGDRLRMTDGFAEIELVAPFAVAPPEAPELCPRAFALGQPRLADD